jgi:transcriptional regulator of nitric oxide reductase
MKYRLGQKTFYFTSGGLSRVTAALTRLSAAIVVALCLVWSMTQPNPALAQSLTPAELTTVFPAAERIGPFVGTPNAAVAYKGNRPIGYVFSTLEVIGSVGYSGKPIDILAGVDNEGTITGAFLKRHQEPILVIGVPEESLHEFVAGFTGLSVVPPATEAAAAAAPSGPDAISGATISSMVIRDSILRAARAVALARGLLTDGTASERAVDRATYEPATWQDLVGEGSIGSLRLLAADLVSALTGSGGQRTATAFDELPAEAAVIDLYATLATPPRIGENLLGKRVYNQIAADLGIGGHAIVVAANGLYSFKGTRFVKTGVFDRVQLVQGERTFRLTKDNYLNLPQFMIEGAPEFREIAVFTIPADSGFDATLPWGLDLIVEHKTPKGGLLREAFRLIYELSDRYLLASDEPEFEAVGDEESDILAAFRRPASETLWLSIWKQRRIEVAVLTVLLVFLTVILVLQDELVANRRVYRTIRLSFLAIILFWLGWFVGGQLSVVNVLTFTSAMITEFHWEFFLLDPISFVLWSYVAVTLLFLGRGVFCGWLCPFGSLQELLNEAARRLRVPQVTVPFTLHERLWPIKYVIFIGLFAVSLHSTNLAVIIAEVEPFKTAIALHFMRAWPFVLYVAVLLVAGLFIERFFCRYLCPLGAALAIPARLRMFEWLKRKHQCGRSCHNCAEVCTVQAIHPNGRINPNECIYCLNCQALYFDNTVCPPLVALRQKQEEARRRAEQRAKPLAAEIKAND